MDDKTVTVIVSLAGTFSTLIVSGLALYFTATARRAPLREAVFQKQVELIVRIISTYGRIKNFCIILKDDDIDFKDQAREDARKYVKEFSEMQEEGAAILPAELWLEVKQLNEDITTALVSYDEKGTIVDAQFTAISARSAKMALIARTVVGADTFTEENLKLFSSKEDYDRLAEMELGYFKKLHRRANAKKDKK